MNFKKKKYSFSFLFFFLLLGCSSAADTVGVPIYVKDVLRLVRGNPGQVGVAVGTGFVVEKKSLENADSQEDVSEGDSLENSELFLVTAFHVVCCDEEGNFLDIDAEPRFNSTERFDLDQVCGIDVVNDLIVYCLGDDFPAESLADSSNEFGQEMKALSQLEKDSSLYVVGFSGLRNHPPTKQRSNLLSYTIMNSWAKDSFYLVSESVGYNYLFMPGISGSPLVNVKDQNRLMGILEATDQGGLNYAVSHTKLQNILARGKIECGNLGECIDWGLKDAFQRAKNGDVLAKMNLFPGENVNLINSMCRRNLIEEDFEEICSQPNELEKLRYQWLLGAAQSGHPKAEWDFFVSFGKDEEFEQQAGYFYLSSLAKNWLLSIYNGKLGCLIDQNASDPFCVPKESSSSWDWLKKLSEFGHIESHYYWSRFLNCDNGALFTDCNDQTAETILEQLCTNNKDLKEIKELKEKINRSITPGSVEERINSNSHLKKVLDDVYKKYFVEEYVVEGRRKRGICVSDRV